jgi:dTDP-4-amino-4,6-dideoxygalactose transaminase
VSRWRQLAPAGTPVGAAALARWAGRLVRGGDAVGELAAAVRARQGVDACVPTATGRAALVLILRALARRAGAARDEVVIPSYTCYTVAAAVVCAGLRPRVVDIDERTLDFADVALDRTDFARVLAIVPTNLFGLPSDLPRLAARARAHGAFVVDDAAQAFGAVVGGRASGTWGEAGLYSLDKGKNITAIEGGLAVANDPATAAALEAEARALRQPARGTVARDAVKLVAYAALLRPWLYGIPNAIPQLQLGTTRYTPEIALEAYNDVLAAMALAMLPRLAAMNEARRRVAAALDDGLRGLDELRPVRPPAGSAPVYLRYPFLAETAGQRDALLAACRERGIGATGSYPTSIVDIPELAELMTPYRDACPVGRDVARRIVTLPTHAYVTPRDVEAMCAAVRRTLRSAHQPSSPARVREVRP